MDTELHTESNEVIEPTTDDADPSNRKEARQLRIKKRYDHEKRQKELIVDRSEDGTLLSRTIIESDDKLFQIFIDGKELVSNIRVASDSREIQRREEELQARNTRLQALEDEASLALEKLKAISTKWDNIVVSNDPIDLNHELREQKARCMELIEQKNDLIMEFKNELKLADERFMCDREAMFEDISMLAKRIDEQVLVMKRSYLAELSNIETAIDRARTDVLNQYQSEWDKLYQKRETDEVSNMVTKFDLMNRTDEEVRQVYIKHDEKFRDTKIKLEIDVQALEQELEQIKALCLLNSEKLDYNYQVLKKREDENVIIKSQQKRTLNKLQEELMILRKKIDEKQSAAEKELARLDKELCSYHRNVIDIEKKADHFSEINDKKFQKIWDMKTEEAVDLLNKILAADKLIHEQILGIDWTYPMTKPLSKEDLISYRAAVAVVKEVINQPENAEGELSTSEIESQTLLNHILSLVADNTGFLVEEKLNELLEPYTSEERTLVRLDYVFNAVGIKCADDIKLLQRYFLPYAVCGSCDHSEEEISCQPTIDEDSTLPHASRRPKAVCVESHTLYIEKIFVSEALREFVTKLHASKFRTRAEKQVKLAKHRCTISRLLSNEDVELYWKRFEEIFTDCDESVWDNLFDGMTRYHAVLKERHKINLKTEKLKQQNSELTRLIARYVPQDSMRLPHLRRRVTPVNTRDLMNIVTRATQ